MAVELINTTGLAAFGFEHMLFQQRAYYIVIVKQSWRMMEGGGLRPLDEPRPVRVGDRFVARPDFSAIALPTDLVPYKPHGEIIVCGSARSAKPRLHWDVEVAMPLIDWSKTLTVFGPRTWTRGLTGWSLPEPLPAQSARIDYAGAYGGHVELPPAADGDPPLVVSHAPNPGGTGWLGDGHGQTLTRPQRDALRAFADTKSLAAPNIEQPAWLPQQRLPGRDVQPLAFGALPAWSTQRMEHLRHMKPPPPDQRGYPADFDKNHWQQTVRDQWCPKEALSVATLELRGLLEEGDASVRIPRAQAVCYVRSRQSFNAVLETNVDTVVIDADARVLEVIERRLISLEEFGDDAVVEVMQRAG